MEGNSVMQPEAGGKAEGGGLVSSARTELESGALPQQEMSVLRVNQLDAGVLDTELHGLLKSQLGRACSGLPAGTLERFKPEVDALFNLLMFRFTIWIQRPTPGMHLQGLRYRNEVSAHRRSTFNDAAAAAAATTTVDAANAAAANAAVANAGAIPFSSVWDERGVGREAAGVTAAAASAAAGDASVSGTTSPTMGSAWTLPFSGDAPTRTQRLLHGLLSVGVQWGFARLRRHGLVHGWGGEETGSLRRIAWYVIRKLETLFRVAWMINLLLFLRNGKYATPLDRLVQMRMVHERTDPGPRSINYQFLNRRLLWDHWAKMAYVVAPLINWTSLRRSVSGGARRLRREVRALGIMGSGNSPSRVLSEVVRRDGRRGADDDTAPTACAECGVNPAKTPYVTGCGHVFCYYCARMACAADPAYACPVCGEYFATSRRWSQSR